MVSITPQFENKRNQLLEPYTQNISNHFYEQLRYGTDLLDTCNIHKTDRLQKSEYMVTNTICTFKV